MDRIFVLAAVCLSALVTGALSQQGTSILSTIPDNSQTSWSLRDFPGVNGNLSPPTFMLAGPVAIAVNQVDQSSGLPKQATWQSSNLTTSPPVLNGQLVPAAGGSPLGSFTLTNPQVQLYGGQFSIDPSSSRFTFTPSAGQLLVSTVNGSLLATPFNSANVPVPIPQASLPQINGQLLLQGMQYELLANAPIQIPIASIIQAVGGSQSGLVGPSYLLLSTNLQAIGPVPGPGGTGRRVPPPPTPRR